MNLISSMSDRETPLRVDFGAHYYPEIPAELVSKHEAIEQFDGAPICTDIEAIKERYDAAGIDRVVLSTPYYMGSADAEATAQANDALYDVVSSHEELYGLASVPVAAGGEAASEELRRAVDLGLHGGALETNTEGIELIDDTLEPVFNAAEETGAPLLVHPNVSFQEDNLDSDDSDEPEDTWKLNSIFGTEDALARSMCKVIHEEVFEQHPNLTLVYHHNGGNIASMLSRAEMWLNRVHRDGGEHLKEYDEFVETLEDHVYVDTAGYFGDPGPFRETFEVLPSSQVLYATDFPYETLAPETFQKIAGMVEQLRPRSEADAVLGGNALDLLVTD